MRRALSFIALFSGLATLSLTQANLCPFCEAINLTFAERLKLNDLVVIAKLLDDPEIPGKDDGEAPQRRFEVQQVLKGEHFIARETQFWAKLKGEFEPGESFLLWGMEPPLIQWAEPIPSDARVEKYLDDIQRLPSDNVQRVVFFQQFFEDQNPVLAADAYDEFAIATYEDLLIMKPQIQRERLLEFLQRTEIAEHHRRLYFTLLGVCGTADDAELLETFLKSREEAPLVGLDSLMACYLCLKGAAGLPLIESRFLDDPDVEYSQIHQITLALRFHGTEVEIVDRQQLIATVRKLLARPRLADVVIPDLARWEDWASLEMLVAMFKNSEANPAWIRVPIFRYLMVCPLPQAKVHLEELKQLDPDAYQRALFLSKMDEGFDEEDDDFGDEDGDDSGAK